MSTVLPTPSRCLAAGVVALLAIGFPMIDTNAKTPQPRLTAAPLPGSTRAARIGPNFAAPSLAFGDRRLGQLTPQGLVVWSLDKMTRMLSVPIKNPRGLGTLADGSLLAFGAPEPGRIQVIHIPNGGGTKKSYPATLGSDLTALSKVFQRGAKQFWVLVPDATPSLNSFKLALLEGELELLESRPLEATASHSLTALPNGVLAYVEGGNLQVLTEPPRTYQLPAEVSHAAFLAPGQDNQHVVVAGLEGPAALLALPMAETSGTATVVHKFETLGLTVHSMDSAAGRVALLLVQHTPPEPARWTVVSYGADGKESLRQIIPWLPDRAPAEPHFVRISSTGLLAIGNQRRLLVIDPATGKELLRDGTFDKGR